MATTGNRPNFLHSTFPEVPAVRIGRLLGRTDAEAEAIQSAIRRQARTLPARHRRDIMRHPLFVMPDRSLRYLTTFDGALWPSAIRSSLLRIPGVGDRYGRIWEDFVARGFEEAGWAVAGRGVRVREAGRTLTDIDLLVRRGSLVLACQIKAMAEFGEDAYSHWKDRQTVLEGVRQSAVVTSALGRNPALLDSVLGKSRSGPLNIQPVVVTNAETFNGWRSGGVPVVSMGGLTAIFRGARVSYFRQEKLPSQPFASESFIAGTEPTTTEFLDLLRNPVDWRIATETVEVEHRHVDLTSVRFLYPDLRHRTGVRVTT